jgi:hypothetical protein
MGGFISKRFSKTFFFKKKKDHSFKFQLKENKSAVPVMCKSICDII